MSRESDSSSSGPQGRGGAAYPSGTPPYGSRPFPSLHPQERPRPGGGSADAAPAGPEAPAAAPDEPKTETTLTTRIRINIPGSRPIPPVVVRTPVDESTPAPAPEPAPDADAAPEAEAPAAETEPEKTSDWFAPRKPPAAGAGPAAPAAPAPSPAPAPGPGPLPGQDSGSTGSTPYLPPPVGAPFDDGRDGSAARGPHDTPAGGFASPFAPQDPFAPERPGGPEEPPFGGAPSAFGTDSFPPGVPRPTEAFPNEPFPGPDPFAPRPDDPQGPPPGGPFGNASAPYAPPREPGAPAAEDPFDGYRPPTGPTSGPATGDMLVPPMAGGRGPSGFRPPVPPGGARDEGPLGEPGPGLGFDPGFRPEEPGYPAPGERVSGDTLVSGIPAVPAPAPEQRAPAPAAPRPAPPKKKGRSKLVLLGVGVSALAVLAYGAGLLMDHADVPKGTTVLGVDIGNQTRDDAVKMLDTALGNRTTAPLVLTIGSRKASLKPSVAGLSIDTQATVRAVAHSDYNPVSVIGSLFGGSRDADPVIVVDEDKLKAALQSVAGANTPGSDGMVRFADGKAIAVPGKPRQSFDVNAAAGQVAAAYRTRAETGADRPIALTVATAPPKVSQAALDAAVNGFGKTAMSDYVSVRAGIHKIRFGPNKSLPKFLTMVPDATGKLQPHIDLTVLQSLYGKTFVGVQLQRANGTKSAVTAQDVANALIPALGATTTAGRNVTLPNSVG